MAVVLHTFAKTTNKSSRAVALSAVMDREPPPVHCLITRWGLSFININSFKMCVGGQVKMLPSASMLHRKLFPVPLPWLSDRAKGCGAAQWRNAFIYHATQTCIWVWRSLKGEGEMVHSKWIAILPVTARDPGSSILGLLCDCTVTVLPQSLLGWPTFFFFFFIVKAVPTSSHFPLLPFLFPSPNEGDKLPGRLSNLGISTRSTRLASPSFPRAQLESSLNRLHCRDDRRLRGADGQVWSLWKKQQLSRRGGKKSKNKRALRRVFAVHGRRLLHLTMTERRNSFRTNRSKRI